MLFDFYYYAWDREALLYAVKAPRSLACAHRGTTRRDSGLAGQRFVLAP